MKNNYFILNCFILLITINSFCQEKIEIAEKGGLKISYQLIKEEEGKKKDSYIIILSAENTNDNNLFYAVQLMKDAANKWNIPNGDEKFYSKLKVRNSTGWFGNGIGISGEKTQLITTDNKLIFEIKKNEVYTKETSFKVKKGVKPLITNTFLKTFSKLDDFDLKISSNMIDGKYLSSCGNLTIDISSQTSNERGDFLIQTTNGKQFIWLRKSETTFIREENQGFTLIFDKVKQSFIYSTSDGVVCNWVRP
ncbi:hypothetical protein ACQY1Q_05915 [Tenacibaculum sp. TC6]|uniref:hypothetical protein n=1 Tax=Tenacibaculum sp. TC6 TaxID=3423223 RepID=UPI003D36F807